MQPIRSYLAVPGHQQRMIEKAASSSADAVFLDLEDAVPESEKGAALMTSCSALSAVDWNTKHVSVRLNGTDSGRIETEISELCRCRRLDAVILPKAESVESIRHLVRLIGKNSPTDSCPLSIELLIETARGMVNVDSLAAADPLVSALHLGVGDFAASIGARSAEIGASPAGYQQLSEGKLYPLDLFAYPMMRVLVAARAFNLIAIDGPCGDYTNLNASAVSATRAASMGFDGKQVIHPNQIETTAAAFTPTADEIAYAKKVKTAIEEAKSNGLGAATVDGKMIDEASLRLVDRVLFYSE